MDMNTLLESARVTLMAAAWKVAGAVVLWLVGRWLIAFALRLLRRALSQNQFDATLARYMQTALSIVLNVALVVAILGFFGVETTTFAALLAAAASRSASRGAVFSPTSPPEPSWSSCGRSRWATS